MEINPYFVLDVAQDATDEEIKRAHRRLVKSAHPDAGGDAAAFDRIQTAYAVLSDPARRKHFDETGSINFLVEDPIEGGVMQALSQILQSFAQNPQLDHEAVDMRGAMLAHLARNEVEVVKTLASARRYAAQIRGMRRRFRLRRRKGDLIGNPLAIALEAQANAAAQQLKAAEINEKIFRRVYATIEGAGYDAPEPPAMRFGVPTSAFA